MICFKRWLPLFLGASFNQAICEEATAPQRFSLKDFIEGAKTHENSEIKISAAQVEYSKARESLASSMALPSGKWDIFAGPSPEAAGSAVAGSTDFNKWGVTSGTQAEIQIPLYTFGAISSGKEAAASSTEAEENLKLRDELNLQYQVSQIYYGYQLAFELAGLAADLESKLQEALESGQRARKRNQKGAPSFLDLEKLQIYLAEVKARKLEAEKTQSQLRAAMAWKAGFVGETEAGSPKWDRGNLKARESFVNEKPLKEWVKFALDNRPESKALQKNLDARRSLEDSEFAQMFPVVFLAGQVRYTVSPHREDPSSPFAYDPLNDLSGVAALGLRWNLNFFEKNAKAAMATAERIKAEAFFNNARQGIQVEVERTLADLEFYKAEGVLREEASKRARKLFTDSFVAFNLGIIPAKDLLEALATHALAQKAHWESIFQSNTLQFKWAQVTGSSINP